MRLSSGRPRNLDTGDDLLRKAVVLGGPGRHRGKREDALLVCRTLLETYALRDSRSEDLLSEHIADLLVDVSGEYGPLVVEGHDHAEELEGWIRSRANLLVG